MKKTGCGVTEKYYPCLGNDIRTNVRDRGYRYSQEETLQQDSSFATREMKQLQKGSVRNISNKLQQEETESRDNCVPEVSALDQEINEVEPDTKEILKFLESGSMSNMQFTQPTVRMNFKHHVEPFESFCCAVVSSIILGQQKINQGCLSGSDG
ncbi:unnamed protein product [Gulo gulo]|uniref:Uncharacterized protein n=1 Tax=Gulo gulo TaxID=48420 RepID=A0A9X9M1L8_GULGU|nr:unnamed protein product [Gulo gulo]